MKPADVMHALRALPPREQRWVALAALVLGVAALWVLALAPALETVAQASSRKAAQAAALAQMQQWAQRAKAIQNRPALPPAQAQASLQEGARSRLGAQATVQIQADQAVVNFKGVTAQNLAAFLAQARSASAASVIQARLERGAYSNGPASGSAPSGSGANGTGAMSSTNAGNSKSSAGSAVLWEGQLTLKLPSGS